MRGYEVFKCRRKALDMTQAELAKILGVSVGYISKFENGEQLPQSSYTKLIEGLDRYCHSLDRDAYLRMRIKEVGYKLEYETIEDQILTLGHLVIHIGKLQMDLMKEHLDSIQK